MIWICTITIFTIIDFYPIEATDDKDGPSKMEKQPAVEIGTGPMIDRPREGLKIGISI